MNLEEQINNINAEIELKNNEIAELCKKIEDTKFENATTIIGKCYSYEHTDCELCSQFLKILDFNKTYGDDEYNDYVYIIIHVHYLVPCIEICTGEKKDIFNYMKYGEFKEINDDKFNQAYLDAIKNIEDLKNNNDCYIQHLTRPSL